MGVLHDKHGAEDILKALLSYAETLSMTNRHEFLTHFFDKIIAMMPSEADDAAKALHSDLKKPYHEAAKHIGLFNINQRIKLIYGEPYGLLIESSPDGTTILLEMEWIE